MSPSLRRIGAACATVGALALAAIGCGGTSAARAKAPTVAHAAPILRREGDMLRR